jgi:Family of unknown function (DUF5681)
MWARHYRVQVPSAAIVFGRNSVAAVRLALHGPNGTRGRPFEKEQSGNHAGRPPGTRHKVSLAAEALLDGKSEALTRKAIDLALAGDTTALRLCLERILPPRKSRKVALELPRQSRKRKT